MAKILPTLSRTYGSSLATDSWFSYSVYPQSVTAHRTVDTVFTYRFHAIPAVTPFISILIDVVILNLNTKIKSQLIIVLEVACLVRITFVQISSFSELIVKPGYRIASCLYPDKETTIQYDSTDTECDVHCIKQEQFRVTYSKP